MTHSEKVLARVTILTIREWDGFQAAMRAGFQAHGPVRQSTRGEAK